MSIRSRKKKRDDLLGILIITFIVVASAFAFAKIFFHEKEKIVINRDTFCPEYGPFSKTIVILDLSDSLNEPQEEFFKVELENIKKGIKKYHNLTIFLLNPNAGLEENKKLSMCNPGTQDDIKKYSFEDLSTDPRKVKKKWSNFSKKISNEVSTLISNIKPINSSPIFETIQLVHITELKDFETNVNEIIILSDMIQHTKPGLSMYSHNVPLFSNFSKGEYFSKIRTNFNENVDVTLHVLRRAKHRVFQQSQEFQAFWANFFVKGLKARDCKTCFKIKYVDG